MTEQRHRILRHVIEFEARDQEAARRLQSEFCGVHQSHLVPVIDRCCSEFSEPGLIHRIDRLEVDLGALDPADPALDLVRKLGPALRAALKEQILAVEARANRAGTGSAASSRMEILEIFAETGELPWWADSSNKDLLDEPVDFLIRHFPRPLVSLLTKLVRDPRRIRRIVLHCRDESLVLLFEAACQTASIRLENAREDIQALLEAQPAVARRSPGSSAEARFRTVVWEELLRSVCRRDSFREPLMFWRGVLAEVALELGLSYISLASAVESYLESRPGARSGPLRAALGDATREAELGGGKKSARVTGAEAAMIASEVEELERALRQMEPQQEPRAHLLAALRSVAGRVPADLRKKLLEALRKSRDQGVSAVEAEAEIERLLPPELVARLAQRRTLFATPAEISLPPEPVARPARKEAVTRDFNEAPSDTAFSEVDTAYVENAGLILLWPFLERFFERLDLLVDRRFRDTMARHRAAGLLQYLASGDLAPVEFQVTLNKVLCGIDLAEIFDFGPSVSEREAEECVNLLTAVIAHAPILKEMSVMGFRGTFLLRRGALCATLNSWLLRVERQTYDIVLDRFPWSFEWIKLPWMEWPLRVEW